jgi:hypothetical protein
VDVRRGLRSITRTRESSEIDEQQFVRWFAIATTSAVGDAASSTTRPMSLVRRHLGGSSPNAASDLEVFGPPSSLTHTKRLPSRSHSAQR